MAMYPAGATTTFTFCECAENHVGMQQIGKIADKGFSLKKLRKIAEALEDKADVEIFDLKEKANLKFSNDCESVDDDAEEKKTENLELGPGLGVDVDIDDFEDAWLLVIRNGINLFVDRDEFVKELAETIPLFDTKAWMKGRVVNKRARHNVCYADFSQEPNYENKMGRVLDFKNYPILSQFREGISLFGEKFTNMYAELNHYYDVSICGCGEHGDSERRRVLGLRIGESMPLCYRWYYQGKPVGEKVSIDLHDGDIYIMSDKAVGNDWKKRKIPTLRHSTGCDKFMK